MKQMSKKIKKGMKISLSQAVLSYWSNNILHVLIKNSRTTMPTKIEIPVLNFLHNCFRMLTYILKKVLTV